MATQDNLPAPKPRSERYRSELTFLPPLTLRRRLVRRILRAFARLLVAVFTRTEVHGLENIPPQGGVLAVSNHLGDADLVLGLAISNRPVDFVAKVELYDIPLLGKLMHAYGVIWIHRGLPDRRALRAVQDGLAEGRMIIIAPEGRESVTGTLEEGTSGAAFLANRSGVPLLPTAITGTENERIYGNMKRLRRTRTSLTIGTPFTLEKGDKQQDAIHQGTQLIMSRIAGLLPLEYRGVYQSQAQVVDER